MLSGAYCASAEVICSAAQLAEKEPDDTQKEPADAKEEKVIREITLTGISAPVVGGNPVYTGIKSGAEEQYHLLDISAGDYRLGGVSWSAQTSASDRVMMLKNDTFTSEKCYTLSILIEPAEGWSFAKQLTEVTATVNGSPAKVAKHADFPDALYISYIFQGTTQKIDLTGIAEPQTGAAPDYNNVRCINPMQYQPDSSYEAENFTNGICWLELGEDGKPLDTPPEKFECGKTYRLTVCVSGTAWYELGSAAEMTATVNDRQASIRKYFGGMVGVECDFKVGGQLGDYDGDGAISVGDAQGVLSYYVETLVGGTKAGDAKDAKDTKDTKDAKDAENAAGDLKTGDVDGDQSVTVDDAQYILLYYTENTLAGVPTTWNEILKAKE